MGDPVRKPKEQLPETMHETSDGSLLPHQNTAPQRHETPYGSHELLGSGQDPDLFGSRKLAEPLVGLNGQNGSSLPGPEASLPHRKTPPTDLGHLNPNELPQTRKSVKRKKRKSFALILVLFLLIGFSAFGAGAGLAYYILNGELDMNSEAVKETIAPLKNWFHKIRSSP